MTVPANEYNVIITQSVDTEISIPIPWPYGNTTSNIFVTQTNISNGETRNSDEGGFSVVSNFDFTEILVEQYSVFAGENTQYRIQRTLPVQQTYDLTEQGNLSSSALEQALDDNVRLMQDIIQNSADRVILSDDPFEIANIAARKGKVFGFDEITGEPVYTGDINDIENISGAVTDAEAAADEAVIAAQAAELAAAEATAAVAEVAKANSDIVDPTINDDDSQGYTENSLWTNTVDNTAFICVEPTTGAAVWQIIEVVVTSRVVTGAVESPVLEDKGNQIIKDGAGSTTIVVQLDSTLDFPIDTKMQVIANGSGAVDIASDLGVLINGVDAVIFPLDEQYSQAFLQKIGADEWLLFGDIHGVIPPPPILPINEYILLEDQKPNNTDGGSSTSGVWMTRVLNTKVSDVDNNCTLSANRFTLDEGTYTISASAPALETTNHKIKLVRDPGGSPSDEIIGTNERPGANLVGTRSFLKGKIVVGSGGETFEVQHRVAQGISGDGLGNGVDFGVIEVYSQVELWKIE